MGLFHLGFDGSSKSFTINARVSQKDYLVNILPLQNQRNSFRKRKFKNMESCEQRRDANNTVTCVVTEALITISKNPYHMLKNLQGLLHSI